MSGLAAVSLFAGVGGFDLALERAGVRVTAAVEIDSGCRGVLGRRFPHTTLFSDIRKVSGEQLRAAGFDPGHGILTAGFPCQDISVAGRRAGLAGARSGLFWEIVRLADQMRPRWLLVENTPGLLSSNRGRDMGTVVGALADLGYGVCWRVLDAQFFGVPQRRRRVFFAGCLGDRAAPVQVLLEPESGAGDPAPGRQARPDVAGTLGSRAGGSRTTDLDGHGTYIVNAITPGMHGRGSSGQPAEDGHLVISTVQGGGRRGHRVDAESAAGVIGTIATTGGGGGWRVGPDEAAAGQLVVSTLQGGGRRGHRVDAEGAAGGHLIAFGAPQITSAQNRVNPQTGGWRARLGYGQIPTARGLNGGVGVSAAVRRLTPRLRECERLQGFPDDWTRWLADGREQSDSARYRQAGNAVAVPVAEWIVQRIAVTETTRGAT